MADTKAAVAHTPLEPQLHIVRLGQKLYLETATRCIADMMLPDAAQIGPEESEITEQWATLIVRAVNCHQVLVDALNECKTLLVYSEDGWDGVGNSSPKEREERIEKAIEDAESAIRRAAQSYQEMVTGAGQ